jgi:hypothetical protein
VLGADARAPKNHYCLCIAALLQHHCNVPAAVFLMAFKIIPAAEIERLLKKPRKDSARNKN